MVGAANGTGRALAQLLARRGFRLLLADYDREPLADLARRLGAVGRYCDIASEASVRILVEEVHSRFGVPVILINAAGKSYLRALGILQLDKIVTPLMRAQQSASLILNVEDQNGQPDPIFSYASSRTSFAQLGLAMAESVRGSQVQVLSVTSSSAVECLSKYIDRWDSDDDWRLAG